MTGDGTGPAGVGVVVRTTRQLAGGTVTVAGSVGYAAGEALEGAGDLLNVTAESVGGTVLLLGDTVEALGRLAARLLTGLGSALIVAGRRAEEVLTAAAARVQSGPDTETTTDSGRTAAARSKVQKKGAPASRPRTGRTPTKSSTTRPPASASAG